MQIMDFRGCDEYSICAKLYEAYYFLFLWCETIKKNEKVAARLLLCTYVVIRIIHLGAYCFVP